MEAGIKRPVAVGLGLAVVVVLGVVAMLLLAPDDEPAIPSDLTIVKDPTSLKEFVELTHLGILTSTNFLGHRVYIVTASLKNISDRPIRVIDVKLTFLDYQKKTIYEEGRTAFDIKNSPLQVGSEYRMEIPFENPPSSWNYHVPDTQVVTVAY
jgi:hypothetical protein